MKQIRTAKELYCEILKSFYFGIYRKDDRLMTYQEAHEVYGLAKKTIGTAYAMLQRDGVIRTDGARGTIVTFDMNNPAHVAKVPIEWPKARTEARPEDTISYEVAMRLHAHSLYTGLMRSNEMQLQASKEAVEDIFKRVKVGDAYHDQVFAFWKCVISSLDNTFLSCITDHFISRYLYLLPPTHLSSVQQRLIRDSALEYYEFLLDALEHNDFAGFPAHFEKHYHNYYQYRGLVFSKLEDEAVFKEQALYRKVLDDFYIKIMSGELRKGDALPTTKHLCAEYGISATTVNRAYGILADMGFISRRVRSGTKLIADLADSKMWETLEMAAGLQQQNWKEAMEAVIIINSALCTRIDMASGSVRQMRMELVRQRKMFECYATPYFVSDVLLSPLIESFPAGILHKYYIQLADVLSRVITLCTFRVHQNEQHGKEIYEIICDALDALEGENRPLYAILSERAMLRNAELLIEDYNRIYKY